MSYSHSLFLAVLACFSVFFSSASKRPPVPLAAPLPAYPVRASAAAATTLDRAIAALDPRRVPWLQATLWQQVSADHLAFQAEGTYQAGPDRRLRIDMQIRCGTASRNWQLICDGQTVWEIETAEGDLPKVQQRPLPTLDHPGERRTAPPDGSSLYGFAGPGPLLQSLRRKVVFTHQETVRWQDRDVVVLTGAHPNGDKDWVNYQPRQCRLVLDAGTLWPHRLEWWGPSPGVTGDIRLVQMEFRRPVLHRPMPEETFTFRPGEPAVDEAAEQVPKRPADRRGWLEGIR